MSEDEKMAIDYLQTHIIPYLKNGNIKFLVNEVILNLIEKQGKKIDELQVINNMQKYRIEVIDERELINKKDLKVILEEYRHTSCDDWEKIIEGYKKIEKLLESE